MPPAGAWTEAFALPDTVHRYLRRATQLPDIEGYHWVVNSSAGKDNQYMLDYVVERADRAEVRPSRLLVARADLGRVEWPGAREVAEEQARHYGLEFVAVSRQQGDPLEHIERRGMFPSPAARFCTSDHERGPIATVFTRRANRSRQEGVGICRILNGLGMRAQESPSRAKRPSFSRNATASNGRREVDDWLPLHAWTVEEVRSRIRESGVRHRPAYDLGMPGLSCCFCIFSPRSALLRAGKPNPEVLAEYVRVVQKIDHRFRPELPLAKIQSALACGEEPGPIRDWVM